MRIAFVTDIHGNLAALEAVVADCTRRAVSRVVNLGDSLSGPLLPAETADDLMSRDWFHLAGNHERQILRHGPGRPTRVGRVRTFPARQPPNSRGSRRRSRSPN